VTGIVKRHLAEKGFGFISDAAGVEYFFHQSACGGDFHRLSEGTKVTFDVKESSKGPRAEEVRRAQ
jgi:CspA family cold shock protein